MYRSRYPADFTDICLTDLQEMARYYSNFTDLDWERFSVSRDSAYVHKARHDPTPERKAIRYLMLADTT